MLAPWAWLCLGPGPAWAGKATPELTLSSSAAVTPGVSAPGVAVPTLAGVVAFDAVRGPSFRAGVAAAGGVRWGDADRVTARWGLWRDQRLCDTCRDGDGPVGVGPDLLGSTDLDASYVHAEPLGGAGELWLAGLLTLPASRDALACNPFVAAPGAGATFRLALGGSTLAVGASARRPVYTHGSAPVGACDAGEVPAVATLGGTAAARPWSGERWGAANPVLSTAASFAWSDLEDALGGIDPRFTTSLTLAVLGTRDGVAPPVAVPTLAGDVTVPAAREPVALQIPWSLGAGWRFGRATALSASLSNALPALLADPGGTFRAQPASTQVGLSLSTTLARPEVP